MIKAKKELGQNFMRDTATVVKMVDALNLQDDEVLEIGPGLGVFTKEIIKRLGKGTLNAIEFDFRLISGLRNQFIEQNRVNASQISIDYSNILDYLPTYKSKTGKYKIFGSLPYYITSPIVHEIIKSEVLPDICVFMVQYEVAKKISDVEPDASYLSSFVQTFFEVSFLGKVDRKHFDPEPGVDGGILKFVKKQQQLIIQQEISSYEKFLHHAYSNPRKMLNKVFPTELLEKAGINPNLRPQNIDVTTWIKLFRSKKSVNYLN